MPDAPERANVRRRPVVYAGRFTDRIKDTELPNDCIVLGEQVSPPRELIEALNQANALTILDLPSLPMEALSPDYRDLPMVLVIPPDSDAGSLVAAFGTVLFEHLTVFDRIASPDPSLWEDLRRRYRWAEGQHVSVANDTPEETAATVCALLGAGIESPATTDQNTTTRHEGVAPYASKALHRSQAAVLDPWFAAAQEESRTGTSLDVLEVGAGVGRWVPSFEPARIRFAGLDTDKELVRAARANFPEQRFDLLGPDLLFPHEAQSFDLVCSVTYMQHHPTPARETLLSEMWRVTRPGGRLLFLENFVFTGQQEEAVLHPMSVTQFEALILEAMTGQVALEHVESLRYPGEDLRRGGLISLLRLGTPRM